MQVRLASFQKHTEIVSFHVEVIKVPKLAKHVLSALFQCIIVVLQVFKLKFHNMHLIVLFHLDRVEYTLQLYVVSLI